MLTSKEKAATLILDYHEAIIKRERFKNLNKENTEEYFKVLAEISNTYSNLYFALTGNEE